MKIRERQYKNKAAAVNAAETNYNFYTNKFGKQEVSMQEYSMLKYVAVRRPDLFEGHIEHRYSWRKYCSR